jgi:hypothetical protein
MEAYWTNLNVNGAEIKSAGQIFVAETMETEQERGENRQRNSEMITKHYRHILISFCGKCYKSKCTLLINQSINQSK